MKFNLYLELGTRAQDMRVLDLLRFPLDAAFLGRVEWSARWWSHGKTKRMRSNERESVCSRLANDGINELELNAKATVPTPLLESRITDAWVSLYPSLTSELWAEVPQVPLKNHADERRRKSFGGGKTFREDYKKKHVLPYPSVAEYSLNIETPCDVESDSQLQALSIELVRRAMPAAMHQLDFFGYGCVHGKCRTQMMLHNLGGEPTWTDQLGEKFENIYPILIGPILSCEGLAGVLSDRCSLIRISEHAPSAIVSIRPDKVEEVRQDPAVREWVVIRDLSKLDAPAATLDAIYERRKGLSWEAPFVKR